MIRGWLLSQGFLKALPAVCDKTEATAALDSSVTGRKPSAMPM